MMRCLSSCFEPTRMWWSTERAALAKKPALVLVIATDRRMGSGRRVKVGSDGADRLDAGFLVIGDHRDRGLLSRAARHRPPHLDLTIDAQHFGHFRFQFGIAPLQVVTHPVRFDLMRGEDLAHCSPGPGWPGSDGRRAVRDRAHAPPAGGWSTARVGNRIASASRKPTRPTRFWPPP